MSDFVPARPLARIEVVHVAENIIVLDRMHLSDVRALEQRLTHLIEFRGYDRFVLDSTHCRVAFPEAIVPLACYVLDRQREGVRFDLKLSVYEQLQRLFLNCNWAHFIAPAQFPDSVQSVGDKIALLRFEDQLQQDNIVNLTLDRLLRTL